MEVKRKSRIVWFTIGLLCVATYPLTIPMVAKFAAKRRHDSEWLIPFIQPMHTLASALPGDFQECYDRYYRWWVPTPRWSGPVTQADIVIYFRGASPF